MILELALESRRAELLLGSAALKRIRDARLRARRFVFDEAASEKAGHFATECADIVCENAQFALPPFPDTYVEIDLRAALRSSLGVVAPDAAERLGFLFLANGDVFTVSGGDPGGTEFNPFRYHRNGEGAPIFVGDEAAWTKRDFLVGEVSIDLRPRVEEFAPRLTDVWEVSIGRDMPGQVLDFMAAECRGQLKRALAALLLLNQRRDVTLVDVPTTRRVRGGKLRPYLAHSVVSIDLGARGIREAFVADERATPRRHEVRGHFVHYGVEEGCSHEWEVSETEDSRRRDIERAGRIVPRWRCANCGGMRVRREAFLRGDASKGFVTKQYEVTDRGHG